MQKLLSKAQNKSESEGGNNRMKFTITQQKTFMKKLNQSKTVGCLFTTFQ